MTCKWVAEVKGPPREGSLHFEPWQQGSCPLCLLPSVPCARSDVQITGLWINTFRSYGKWTGCHWPTWLPVGAPGTCCGSSGSGTISDGEAVPRHGTMPIVEATRPGQAVAVAGDPTDPWPVLRGSPAARECRWSRPPDPGKPWQWQVTPLIHGRCCGGPPQPENAVGRGPPQPVGSGCRSSGSGCRSQRPTQGGVTAL